MFDEFFSTGLSSKPGSVENLPQINADMSATAEIRSSAQTPPAMQVSVEDLPDLAEMLERRDERIGRQKTKKLADDSMGSLGERKPSPMAIA